jgi:NAD(P)-dependent dehydrogenase (short-subunit alcohol dehydrogenase family)
MSINDKVVLVTGAGQGIGRAIALRLAHDGADIARAVRVCASATRRASRARAVTSCPRRTAASARRRPLLPPALKRRVA